MHEKQTSDNSISHDNVVAKGLPTKDLNQKNSKIDDFNIANQAYGNIYATHRSYQKQAAYPMPQDISQALTRQGLSLNIPRSRGSRSVQRNMILPKLTSTIGIIQSNKLQNEGHTNAAASLQTGSEYTNKVLSDFQTESLNQSKKSSLKNNANMPPSQHTKDRFGASSKKKQSKNFRSLNWNSRKDQENAANIPENA